MGIRNRFIYFAGRAAAGVCAALGIWWSCAMTSFADEAIKSVTIAVTSSVEMGGSGGAGREPGGAGREPGGAGQESGSAGTAQDSAGTAGGRSVKSIGGTEFGRNVADYALQFVGNPYVYGGTSLTGGTDCSGYTQSVYRHFGVSIPRTSGEQAGFGREIPYEDMEPGDLVCYSGHVAMYIGGGRIVHASSRKEGIKVSNDPAYRTIVSIRRPWQ